MYCTFHLKAFNGKLYHMIVKLCITKCGSQINFDIKIAMGQIHRFLTFFTMKWWSEHAVYKTLNDDAMLISASSQISYFPGHILSKMEMSDTNMNNWFILEQPAFA